MKGKLVSIIDKLLIVVITLSSLMFILYPFIAVFQFNIKESLLIDYKTYSSLFFNSLKVAGATTVISLIFSLSIAIFYFIWNSKLKRVIFIILALGIISPPFVTSLAYINLFGRRGLITHFLLNLDFNPYGFTGIVLMQSLNYLAINTLLLIGFISSINNGVINSAKSLGASTNRIIVDIILPLLRPAIIVVILLTFIRSMSDFGTPAIIGGSYKTLSLEGYLSFIVEGDIKKSTIINFLIFIPASVIFFIYSKFFKNISLNSSEGENIAELRNNGLAYWICFIMSVVGIFSLFCQYMSIIFSAFTTREYGRFIFTFENFISSFEYGYDSLIRSIVYSIIVAIIVTLFGHILHYYIHIRKIKFLKIVDFIVTMPYIVPGTFFGLGYVLAFNSAPIELTGTAAIVVLNLIFKQLPFATKIGYNSIAQINVDLIKSVRDLGGSRVEEVKDIILPLSRKGLYISFVNSFTSTMTTIGSIIFLVYPSQKVITLVMFDAIESGKYDVGSVMAFYIIVICIVVNILNHFILNRRK